MTLLRNLSISIACAALATPLAAQQAAPKPSAVGELPPPSAAGDSYTSPLMETEYLEALGKLPDWNGTWIMQAAPRPRPAQLMFDPENFHQPAFEGEPSATGPVAGSYLTGIPFKPEYRQQYMDNVKKALEGKSVDAVGALCRPYGGIRLMGGQPSGPEITITPEKVVMYFDTSGATRQIYTDGRGHPGPDEYLGKVPERWNGHSIGRWEGTTLVVDTIGYYPAFYDQTGAPYSDQVHVTERIRLLSWRWLENRITVEDPVMLERPWTVTRLYRRNMGAKYPNMNDAACAPGEAMDFSQGYQRAILPSEIAAEEEKKKAKGK